MAKVCGPSKVVSRIFTGVCATPVVNRELKITSRRVILVVILIAGVDVGTGK
jgi:hypothetical protein